MNLWFKIAFVLISKLEVIETFGHFLRRSFFYLDDEPDSANKSSSVVLKSKLVLNQGSEKLVKILKK